MSDDQEQESEEDQQYLTVKEAAQWLRVSTKTLRDWTSDKLIEVVKPSGKFGRVRISVKAIKAFIEKHTNKRGEQNDE